MIVFLQAVTDSSNEPHFPWIFAAIYLLGFGAAISVGFTALSSYIQSPLLGRKSRSRYKAFRPKAKRRVSSFRSEWD
ncbi:hypothetical protein [Calothrix sp. 336/3]|uniref:hypothetical protein n=1 Tax=Calothrix sp. 336/3 TaxID=1337936 RepID=UPI0004E39CF5|nr:hypothetical protein [Calothrix sp. 336/3]AKG23564.1 hypothetical protein IJ00_21810 [Calothrix sp. 336/3]